MSLLSKIKLKMQTIMKQNIKNSKNLSAEDLQGLSKEAKPQLKPKWLPSILIWTTVILTRLPNLHLARIQTQPTTAVEKQEWEALMEMEIVWAICQEKVVQALLRWHHTMTTPKTWQTKSKKYLLKLKTRESQKTKWMALSLETRQTYKPQTR